jgi:hypothetical protein
LPIYKGDVHPPVTFNDAGIVVLGCNIHDQMLGYIVVVGTPVFAKTDNEGVAILVADPAAGGTVTIWSPRIRDDEALLSANITALPGNQPIAFRLSKKLYPAFDQRSDTLTWPEY